MLCLLIYVFFYDLVLGVFEGWVCSPSPSIALNGTHLLITGGKDGSIPLKTSELISLDNSHGPNLASGPTLPKAFFGHCFLKVSSSRAILVGGEAEDGKYSKDVFLLAIPTLEWNIGPNLAIGRKFHACASFQDPFGNDYVVVAGGEVGNDSTTDSVEILDLLTNTWTRGPSLPYKLQLMQMVTSPDGQGVIVIGGTYDAGLTFSSDFLKLTCSEMDFQSCSWELMEHQLKLARYQFVAMYISKDLAICGL